MHTGYNMHKKMPQISQQPEQITDQTMDKLPKHPAYRFSIAPMLDLTDRHCRYFLRCFSRQMLLYSEMITSAALLHGKGDYLAFDESEHPLALQLGGNDPLLLARCARIGEKRGYNEINLNAGCPSNRVSDGQFGACLMAQPVRVADCIRAMRDAVSVPVTLKTRIGIDHQDSYAFLRDFIGTVAERGGCERFIIHARKAWLFGLSPKQNRQIPPLDYSRVYQLKRDFPQLMIILNGGISTLAEAHDHLLHVDGVMLGRAAYQQPEMLAAVDREIFATTRTDISAIQVIQALYPYIQQQLASGSALHHITRHLSGLFQGRPGARLWRQHLSTRACLAGAGTEVLQQALAKMNLSMTTNEYCRNGYIPVNF